MTEQELNEAIVSNEAVMTQLTAHLCRLMNESKSVLEGMPDVTIDVNELTKVPLKYDYAGWMSSKTIVIDEWVFSFALVHELESDSKPEYLSASWNVGIDQGQHQLKFHGMIEDLGDATKIQIVIPKE